MENAGCFAERSLHFHPMPKVIAHVISAERQHGHWIAPHFPHGACTRGSRFWTHRGTDVDSSAPVKRLKDERNGGRPPPSKNNRADGHTGRILPTGINRGTLGGRRSKA